MKKFILLFVSVLMLASCSNEGVVTELEVLANEAVTKSNLFAKGGISVCHKNGGEIAIGEEAVQTHIDHGDAVDRDGDGFYHIDNPCSETDCDDSSYSEDNSCEIPATIGDLRDGGVVFWVDPADNTKGKVCMLVADEKQLNWDSAMFTFYTNTDTGTGVYSNWYLPSKDELQLMYANLKRFGCSTNTPGGLDYDGCATEKGNFSDYYYWSSTEDGSNGAWEQDFANGDQGNNAKFYTGFVRAVRAF